MFLKIVQLVQVLFFLICCKYLLIQYGPSFNRETSLGGKSGDDKKKSFI